MSVPTGCRGPDPGLGRSPVPAGRAERVSGRNSAGASRRWIPGGAHADGLGVERRLPGMAEAVHCVNPEDHRNVQPRILDRVLLDHVVLVGPVVAGVPGAAVAGCIRRVVRTARKQRARVVVDQPRLHAALVQLGPALAAACVGRTGQVVDELLVDLADLPGKVIELSRVFTRAWTGCAHRAMKRRRVRRRGGALADDVASAAANQTPSDDDHRLPPPAHTPLACGADMDRPLGLGFTVVGAPVGRNRLAAANLRRPGIAERLRNAAYALHLRDTRVATSSVLADRAIRAATGAGRSMKERHPSRDGRRRGG